MEAPSYHPAALEEVRNHLVQEEGLIFYPPDRYTIPILNTAGISSAFGEENLNGVIGLTRPITRFIQGRPVGDRFGNQHEERRVWKQEMHQKYGPMFDELCVTNNPFRTNVIELAMFSFGLLSEVAEDYDDGIGSRLASVTTHMQEIVAGNHHLPFILPQKYTVLPLRNQYQVVQELKAISVSGLHILNTAGRSQPVTAIVA